MCRLSAFYAPEGHDGLEAAIALVKTGAYQKSEAILDDLLKQSDSVPAALYWKAYIQFATQRYADSAANLRHYVDRRPEDAQARKLLGLDLFMIGNSAGAQAELERAVTLLPKDEESRYYLGRVYFTRQNMPAALAMFQEILEFAPDSVRARNQLGQTHEALNQFELAEKAYQEAIQIDRGATKRSEWPLYNLGVLHLKAGKPDLALPLLSEALRIQPKFAQARVQRAIALSSTGKPEDAKNDLEAAITEEPQNAEAHYQLGRLYMKQGEQARAKEHLLRFQALRQK